MTTIKAYTSYDEMNKKRFYRVFDIVDKSDLENLDNVEEVALDVEQGRDDVRDYDYFKITSEDDFGDEEVRYVAIKKSALYDWNIEFYPANFTIFISRFDPIKDGYDSMTIPTSVDGMTFDDEDDFSDWVDGIMNSVNENGYFDEDDVIDMERMIRNRYDELIGADDDED